MSTNTTLTQQPRTNKRTRGGITPASAGLPDPRPLTEYDVLYEEIAGASRITITLLQPCIIRSPLWAFIDCTTGEPTEAASITVVGNNTIIFDFGTIISSDVILIDVPYQDMQVQNFQGGFVRPGARWFRAPK